MDATYYENVFDQAVKYFYPDDKRRPFYFKIPEAAKILGIGKAQLKKLCLGGEIESCQNTSSKINAPYNFTLPQLKKYFVSVNVTNALKKSIA